MIIANLTDMEVFAVCMYVGYLFKRLLVFCLMCMTRYPWYVNIV